MISSIITAILVLSFLIFIHELFHFIAAKMSGIRAPVFSIGFGPKIFSLTRWNTEFRISAILFGGYVELKGMQPEEIKGEEDEFYSKKAGIRIGVVLAGPFANLLLGYLIYLSVLSINGINTPSTTTIRINGNSQLKTGDRISQIDNVKIENWYDISQYLEKGKEITVVRNNRKENFILKEIEMDSLRPYYPPTIGKVIRDGPADKSGLEKGDRIIEINGKKVKNWLELTEIISPSIGETLSVEYTRNSDTSIARILPEKQKEIKGDSLVTRAVIGITSPSTKIKISILKSFKIAGRQTLITASQIFKVISMLINRKVSARNVAGPVGIVMMTQETLKEGIMTLINFIALISINLAIVNMIPIPPADGFHFITSIITSITGNKPSKKVLQVIQTIGVVILLSLMVFLIFNDIFRIFRGG